MIINRGRFEFRCSPELHNAIKWAAFRRHLSVNAFITKVLEVAVEADIAEEQARQAAQASATAAEHPAAEGAQ